MREVLEALEDKAKTLRDAGVRRLRIDGLEVELAPAEPAIVVAGPPERAELLDPLDDPDTFGGRMPSFRRLRDEERE